MISEQFDRDIDDFDLIPLNKSDKIEYAIKFNLIDISISKIEDLIYQKACMKSLVEKTFESLKSLSEKLTQVEMDLKVNERYK